MEDNLKSSVKDEPHDFGSREAVSHPKPDEPGTPTIDYNKLYGDLYRKMITTPVTEIFPHISSPSAPTAAALASAGSPLLSPMASLMHPAFAAFGACALPTLGHPSGGLGAGAFGLLPAGAIEAAHLGRVKAEKPENGEISRSPEHAQDTLDDIYAEHIRQMEGDMDLEKLVEIFKDTLEKFGVSQRFAARFIMQDTSQGNLSFLMEKGKTRKWAELSPRGRLPYLRMKAWLESSEQQQYTLNMLKQSQDCRKSTPRESYSRRERFSMFQIHVLCRLFEENPNPPMNIRNAVAERLDIPLDRVNVWFQNQRARGFPARKFLTDRVTQEMSSMQTNTSPSSTRNSDPMSSIDFATSSEAVASIMRGIPTSTMNEDNVRMANMPSPISPSLQNNARSRNPSEDDYQKPLDFSTKSAYVRSTSKLSSPTSSPSSSIGALSEIVENMNSERKYQCQSSPTQPKSAENVQMNGSTEKVNSSTTSGAAKRKRGLKPQHIIHESAQDINTDNTNKHSEPTLENQSSTPSKRIKLENVHNTCNNSDQSAFSGGSNGSNDSINAQEPLHADGIDSIETNTNAQFKQHLAMKVESDNDTNKENYANKSNIKQTESTKNSLTPGSLETPALSAEETVALVHTLYTNKYMHKSSPSTLAEPELD